ncbi:Acetolactate synthase 1 [Hibiscus syriacus]|uniref:Acetolactate synthase 1 n=1 Tax=Hibiscus syriacus TaxID=106335 RepID=A0A6A2Z1E2_HIBSY|nr:Acetolactate synthase 1 [Hibiscus syriacus]
MLGMHGTVYANYAVDKSDLLLAFGARFDDRVTGNLEAFSNRAKIVHVDIDSVEIGKNKQPHLLVCSDVKLALKGMNRLLESKGANLKLDYSAWIEELNKQKVKYPLNYKTTGDDAIPPQYAVQLLDELTDGNVIVTTGVGEDMFCNSNKSHPYLGNPWNKSEIFPNMMKFADACGISSALVTKKEDLREAIRKMFETPRSYLLDVIVSHRQHVLPVIPSGRTFKNVITKGDGRTKY